MSTPPRSGSSASGGGAAAGELFRVAIVGAAGLKGKEIKEVIEQGNFPAIDVKLLDDDESLGQLEAVSDEATFIQAVRPEQFDGMDFVFFATDAEFAKKNRRPARAAGATIVDLSYGLEDEGAIVRAPWVERETGREEQPTEVAVVSHPAAIVLALLMLRLRRTGAVRTAVATIFEPASEHGRRGMDELHQQTVNLLSFQSLPKQMYDAQVAFNMLSEYGAKASSTLESVERRIVRHFKRLVRDAADVPSMVLVQAPIFHAHVISLYIELSRTMSVGDVAQSMAGPHLQVARAGEDSPSNVSAAGQDTVLLSLRRDAMRDNALWLWAAADNLRVAAINAVECAISLASTRGKKG